VAAAEAVVEGAETIRPPTKTLATLITLVAEAVVAVEARGLGTGAANAVVFPLPRAMLLSSLPPLAG
jgi:hypothetical protein